MHLSFYPTVSPVAAGGYFWLFFPGKRNYGNLLVTDPSHPAFLLPGQELESGNARAFASLEACRPEGERCGAGIDCCCGFCTNQACACKPATPSPISRAFP